jgi:ATP-binding cassette subfamily C protein CydC
VIIGATAIILLIFATNHFGSDSFGVNWIAAFVLAIFPVQDALTAISTGIGEWPRYKNSIQRLNQMDDKAQTELQENVTQEKVAITHPEIKFNQVNFGYNDATVLENLNLTIKDGQKLAILGQSGAGKTTFLKLLLGDEQPNKGTVTINNYDVKTLQEERSSIIAVLDQQPYLFASSVANNLRLGNLDATNEELWQALQQVSLADLVKSLPEGLDTPMTEMGNRFSGGEKQRFALARVLLQNTPIVILDEPTVALDPITELNVLNTIFEVLADRTIIWVTHHLTGIELVDQLIFIEDKKISMQGTPQQLMVTELRFKKLLELDHGDLTDK